MADAEWHLTIEIYDCWPHKHFSLLTSPLLHDDNECLMMAINWFDTLDMTQARPSFDLELGWCRKVDSSKAESLRLLFTRIQWPFDHVTLLIWTWHDLTQMTCSQMSIFDVDSLISISALTNDRRSLQGANDLPSLCLLPLMVMALILDPDRWPCIASDMC